MFVSTPAGGVVFYPAAGIETEAIAAVQATVRRRLLASFVRRGRLERAAARTMHAWPHDGGFSVDASVRIAANDRAGRRCRPLRP